MKEIEKDVERLPGVRSGGAAVSGVPVTGNGNTTWFHIPDCPWHGEHFDAAQRDVTPNYFTTLGAHLLGGRYFDERDSESRPPVAIVNRSFLRTYFSNENPVGKQIVEHIGSGLA